MVLAISLTTSLAHWLGSLSSQNPPSINDFRVTRSLQSVKHFHIDHVIDRKRFALCDWIMRQLFVVFCPLALRSSPGTEHPFRHLELCCFLGWFHSASYQQHAVLIVSLEKDGKMTSMLSSNEFLKRRKMKTQSREAIKPTRIGSTLPKTGEDGLY